jgi:light-regulated signal transduction histidine kinase (bacteriophytochrome)
MTEHLWVRGDPRLLRQVMTNLLGNAWKFSSRKPQVWISVGRQKNAEGETVYFVADRGAGFDMAYASRLFGAFQRLHAPTEFEGTGIGLALVQKIISGHGGRIWAQAQPGEGATFYFTLPGE